MEKIEAYRVNGRLMDKVQAEKAEIEDKLKEVLPIEHWRTIELLAEDKEAREALLKVLIEVG